MVSPRREAGSTDRAGKFLGVASHELENLYVTAFASSGGGVLFGPELEDKKKQCAAYRLVAKVRFTVEEQAWLAAASSEAAPRRKHHHHPRIELGDGLMVCMTPRGEVFWNAPRTLSHMNGLGHPGPCRAVVESWSIFVPPHGTEGGALRSVNSGSRNNEVRFSRRNLVPNQRGSGGVPAGAL